MASTTRAFLLAAACCLMTQAPAAADAIVRTMAMRASTIAEISLEEGRAEVELEIGLADLEAFRNLMPDEIYERLGNDPEPLRERFGRFFTEDLVLTADGGPPLPGRILEMEARPRVRRDEITGEPLPAAGEDPEQVVFARLEYLLPGRPATVTLGGRVARATGVGFVAYHRGVPVNDFRYLSLSQTLNLDWGDPWYTSFERRALRRAYYAPMSGFLYVEPYEVRKEIIARPKDLQRWLDLGLEGLEVIPAEMQAELKRKVAAFLRGRQPVKIDGVEIEPDLAQINFLERTLTTSRVIDPPVDLEIDSAILGAIFVYPTQGLPNRVTMAWDMFDERIRMVSASAVDQAGPLPTYLEPDFSVLEWENFLKNPQMPTLVAVSVPPGPLARAALYARWPLGVLALLAIGLAGRSARRGGGGMRGRAAIALALVILTAAGFWIGRGAGVSDERATEVVAGLLHNIYRAFDFREEERIYDTLERSVAGDLLTRIYLETRRGLELANQGGARAKVKEIEMAGLEAAPAEGGGFRARATWIVGGSVGHWGHVHQRRNQYQAELDIRPVAGAWKLAGIEILQEERL